jgi:hypothetical protein
MNLGPIGPLPIESGQVMGLAGAMTAEQPPRRDRTDIAGGVYSASREGKRLNMLGFDNPIS